MLINVNSGASLPSPSFLFSFSQARERKREESRAHRCACARALRRCLSIPSPAPLTRPRSREDTRFSARFGGNARIRGVPRESRAFSVERFHGGYGTDFSSAKPRRLVYRFDIPLRSRIRQPRSRNVIPVTVLRFGRHISHLFRGDFSLEVDSLAIRL